MKELKSTDWSLQNIYRDVKYRVGNIVNSIIILYGTCQVLEVSGEHFVYDYLTIMFYAWNKFKIISKVNCNWKKKLRKRKKNTFGKTKQEKVIYIGKCEHINYVKNSTNSQITKWIKWWICKPCIIKFLNLEEEYNSLSSSKINK